MVQPFDYTTTIGNPGGAFEQAYAQGLQLQAVQEAQAMARMEAQRKAAEQQRADQERMMLRQGMVDWANAKTPAEKIAIGQKNPILFAQIAETGSKYDKAINNALADTGLKGFALLNAGDATGAATVFRDTATALRNSNQPALAEEIELLAKGAETSPAAANDMVQFWLVKNAPERFAQYGETLKKVGEGQEAVTKAGAAAEQRPLDLRAKTADAIVKEVEAKFKPKQLLADLGLKGAQTQSAQASAAASSASAAASRASAARDTAAAGQINAGIIPADKRPEAEAKFRNEYSDRTKGYQDVKAAFSRITASQDNAAGDLSLIFNYMKMLDPGSTVREGEFASAQNATGVPSRILNAYNNVINGERLNPEQRKQFLGQARTLYTQARVQENTVRKGVERIAKGYGLNPNNIFYEAVESAPVAPTVAPTPSGNMPPQQAAIINRANAIVARGRT